jgi:predicted nucleic acid-binding protein
MNTAIAWTAIKLILVDTSIWISALHGYEDEYSDRLQNAIATGGVLVGDLILLEVLRGARSDAAAARLRRAMSAFPVAMLAGEYIAERAAANYRNLRQLGITVRSSIDVVIATFCIEGTHTLLHKDRDFLHFEKHLGLRRY